MSLTRALRLLTLAAATAVVLVPAAALADEAPPPDYEETCTIEKQRQSRERCVTCEDVRPAPDEERCEARMSPQGYSFRCAGWGATVVTTVWCKSDPTAPPVEKKSSCAASSPAGMAAVAAALGVLLVLALGRARRRRS